MIRAPSSQANNRKRAKASQSRIDALKTLVNLLRIAWSFLFLIGESVTYTHRIHRCNWPRPKNLPRSAKAYRVLIVADPQIPDVKSHTNWLRNRYVDYFSSKCWRIITAYHKPDAFIFLGDLLASGVNAADRLEHAQLVDRFHQLFPLPKAKPVLYVMGNRDVGLHNSQAISLHAREQFRDAFGPTQGVQELGNHSFIFIDSMGLLEQRSAVGGDLSLDIQDGRSPLGFVKNLTRTYSPLPRVLLSHIPLHREEGTSCGPNRESRTPITMAEGDNYQTLLNKDISKLLLEYTSPSIIFSGQDHDHCQISHKLISPASYSSSVPEITIRSMGMNQGVRHPGYQLLSLYNPDPSTPVSGNIETFATLPCVLPNQNAVVSRFYIPFAFLSLLLIIAPKARKAVITSNRRVSTVRTTRLPSHMSTNSRASFGGSNRNHRRKASSQQAYLSASSSEESDLDYSPTYGTQADVGYSYFPSETEEGVPSPAQRPSLGRLRRVSRLQMWEGSKRRGSSQEEFGGLLSRLRPFLKRFSPLFRILRRLARLTRLDLVVKGFKRVGGHSLVRQSIKDAFAVFWVACLVYLLIYWRWTW